MRLDILSHKMCPRKQTEPKLLILASFFSGEDIPSTNTSYCLDILSHKMCPRKQTDPKLLILASFFSGEDIPSTNTSYCVLIKDKSTYYGEYAFLFYWVTLYAVHCPSLLPCIFAIYTEHQLNCHFFSGATLAKIHHTQLFEIDEVWMQI